MKILMICDFFNRNQLYQENLLAKYYQKFGHEVSIIASKHESIGDYYKQKSVKNIEPSTCTLDDLKIIRLNYAYNIYNRIRFLDGIYEKLIIESPDIIYVHGLTLCLFPCVRYKKKNTNTKIIFDIHADYSNSGTNWISLNILHRLIYGFVLRTQLKFIDNLFAVTPRGQEFVKEVYKISSDKLKFLPLGADTDEINVIQSTNSRTVIKKKLGISPNSFIIFTGGKLVATKRTELVIEAVINLNVSHVHLLVIGNDQDISYYEGLRRASKNCKNIHFLGWLNPKDIYKFLYASDIAVFPNSPSVLWQQAIASGLPLIIGDVFGNAEYLNKFNNAYILREDSHSSEEIKNLINNLLNNKRTLINMKAGAVKTTKETLSYNIIAHKSITFD